MANELIQAGPYPVPADSPDGPNQMKAIVDWIAGRSVMRFATVAARDTALPSGTVADGQLCFVAADNAFYVRVSGAWQVLWQDTRWTAFAPASGYAGTYRYRRIGLEVEVRWQCTTSIAAGAFINPLFTLPVDAPLPSTDVPAAVYGAFAQPMTAMLGSAGALYIRNNHTAAAATHNGSARYFTG